MKKRIIMCVVALLITVTALSGCRALGIGNEEEMLFGDSPQTIVR